MDHSSRGLERSSSAWEHSLQYHSPVPLASELLLTPEQARPLSLSRHCSSAPGCHGLQPQRLWIGRQVCGDRITTGPGSARRVSPDSYTGSVARVNTAHLMGAWLSPGWWWFPPRKKAILWVNAFYICSQKSLSTLQKRKTFSTENHGGKGNLQVLPLRRDPSSSH